MITFDKLKIVTSIDYIDHFSTKHFVAMTKFDEVIYYKYQQKTPYLLLIMLDYQHNELVIEFSGKILLDNYPRLINSETINQCLLNINKLNICKLDVEAILHNSDVVKCDVTKDIECDTSTINRLIGQSIVNYAKWSFRGHKNGCVIENIVSTPKYKKRLSIYNKSNELRKATNTNFINSLDNSQGVVEYYENKTRFELNLNTKYLIRQLLNIPNNSLQNVLSAKTNPILSVVDEAVKFENKQYRTHSLRDYERELLLRECDFDLVKVEAKVRALSSKNTSIKRVMQPYRELYAQITSTNSPAVDIRELVA